ncbi:hypothetical protein AB4865_12210 [Capnocytophaga sp. ARDL2]|uniref:hypothetical protein n=1 Tax=Capnocytophaga sp. ARDL2 TaxID=3238809 RepID=UPI0035585893
MMKKYDYKNRITAEEFYKYKERLQSDKDFTLIPVEKSAWEEHKTSLLVAIFLIPVALVGLLLIKNAIEEMLDYQLYVVEKKKYFQLMKYFILKSETYEEFVKEFYEGVVEMV